MRIALIAPFGLQPKGTVSARMVPLAQALAQRGRMVRVVIPPWDDPSAQAGNRVSRAPSEEGQLAGVQVVTLPLPEKTPRSLALTYGLVKAALRPPSHAIGSRAERTLSSFRPDVVHVFKPVGYSGLAGLVLSMLRVPWVLDTDDWEGSGGWADVNPYSAAQRLTVTLQEAMLPRMARAVTVASRTLEARTWGFGLPRRRVFYMPNGVWREKYGAWADLPPDKARLAALKKQHGLGRGPVILLYTRFAEFPYRWPLDVLQSVARKHPRAHLLVVGSGFFGEEEKLQAEASHRGISDRVITTGRVPEEDLPAYLSLGDVALYPMADTLLNRAKSPVKVLEPMLMGLPIVAHAVGEAAEFIGDAGVLVPAGDLQGMAEAVSALLESTERRKNLGQAAQERVWAEFNWERLCEVAEEAYKVAIG